MAQHLNCIVQRIDMMRTVVYSAKMKNITFNNKNHLYFFHAKDNYLIQTQAIQHV